EEPRSIRRSSFISFSQWDETTAVTVTTSASSGESTSVGIVAEGRHSSASGGATEQESVGYAAPSIHAGNGTINTLTGGSTSVGLGGEGRHSSASGGATEQESVGYAAPSIHAGNGTINTLTGGSTSVGLGGEGRHSSASGGATEQESEGYAAPSIHAGNGTISTLIGGSTSVGLGGEGRHSSSSGGATERGSEGILGDFADGRSIDESNSSLNQPSNFSQRQQVPTRKSKVLRRYLLLPLPTVKERVCMNDAAKLEKVSSFQGFAPVLPPAELRINRPLGPLRHRLYFHCRTTRLERRDPSNRVALLHDNGHSEQPETRSAITYCCVLTHTQLCTHFRDHVCLLIFLRTCFFLAVGFVLLLLLTCCRFPFLEQNI
ncbi:unnamed protein product, partial [Heligmosomoides polygyrus]|uniref:Transmembrane protein n=1 Tax=Heligmosomoides polygyrus TaxID=6339 RepID=A0A183FSI3_HELPZ